MFYHSNRKVTRTTTYGKWLGPIKSLPSKCGPPAAALTGACTNTEHGCGYFSTAVIKHDPSNLSKKAWSLGGLVQHWVNRGTGELSHPHERQQFGTQTSHAPWWLVLVSQFIQVLENSFREQDNKNRSVNMATSFPPHPFL